MDTISSLKLPDDKTAVELVSKARNDSQTLNDLVKRYTSLVNMTVNKWSKSTYLPKQDLTQEAFLGLLAAVRNFDAKHKVYFSYYAFRTIEGYLKMAIKKEVEYFKSKKQMEELMVGQPLIPEYTESLHEVASGLDLTDILNKSEISLIECQYEIDINRK